MLTFSISAAFEALSVKPMTQLTPLHYHFIFKKTKTNSHG